MATQLSISDGIAIANSQAFPDSWLPVSYAWAPKSTLNDRNSQSADAQFCACRLQVTMPRDTTAEIKKRFGNRLRSVRLRCGFTQEGLAFEAGMHRTYVVSVESGDRNVTLVTIRSLAKALGVTMAELMPDFSTDG